METKAQTGKSVGSVAQRSVIAAGLLYLLLPNILFLFGWVQWPAAAALSAILLAGGCIVYRKSKVQDITFTRRDAVSFILTQLLGLLTVELISFHGHIQQAGDFYVRNPIYQTLIREDWPLFSERGEHFAYYFAHWLVPAAIAKLTDFLSPASILFIWTWTGIALALALAFLRLKGRVLPFFAILLAMGSIPQLITAFAPSYLEWHAQNGSFQSAWGLFKGVNNWLSIVIYPAGSGQFFSTFNHAVPFFVFFCFLISKGTQKSSILFLSALILTGTPLGGVAVLPLLALVLLPSLNPKGIMGLLKDPSLYCGILYIPVVALFFGQNESSCHFLLTGSTHLEKYGVFLVFAAYAVSAACILLPMWYFLGRRLVTRTAYGMAALILCLGLPLIVVGVANNELLFKGSWIMYCSLALLYTAWWSRAATRRKKVFVVILLLSSGMLAEHLFYGLPSLSFSEEGMQRNHHNEWEGHLNHPEHWVYKSFWAKELPSVFYNTPGESWFKIRK